MVAVEGDGVVMVVGVVLAGEMVVVEGEGEELIVVGGVEDGLAMEEEEVGVGEGAKSHENN